MQQESSFDLPHQLAQTYGQRQYFFAAAPIYDLISWGLADNVHDKTKGLNQKDSLQSEFYNSEYDITFNRPLYADKRDRHKEPYFKHLAETLLHRGAIRAELSELKDKLLSKNERQRARRFNAFLKKKKKIEKVEP